jgi:neuronal growth regulator 1
VHLNRISGQTPHRDIDIECHIEAYPLPAIIWVKNDMILSDNEHLRILHLETGESYIDSTLRVVNIKDEHFGDYRCKAVNKFGWGSAVTHLQKAKE